MTKIQKSLIAGSVMLSVLVIGITTWAQTSPTQVTACARPNGEVYLIGPNFNRQSCSGQQVEISWPTLAGAPKQLHLFDGDNQDLGIILSGAGRGSPNQAYSVYVPTHDLVIDYGIDLNAISANIGFGDSVNYSGLDCTGIASVEEGVTNGEIGYASPQNLFSVSGRVYRKNPEISTTTVRTSIYSGGACQNLNSPEFLTGYTLTEYSASPVLLNPSWPLKVVQTQF